MSDRAARRRWLRRVLLLVIAALYVFSIPWYRETGVEPAIWLGLPDWVAVALGCYVIAAIANACAWLLTDIEDSPSGSTGAASADATPTDPRA
jgi:hypothetical protein